MQECVLLHSAVWPIIRRDRLAVDPGILGFPFADIPLSGRKGAMLIALALFG